MIMDMYLNEFATFFDGSEADKKVYPIFLYLADLWLSCFEWQNLPESVNERFLEMTLMQYGRAVYFNDPVIGNLALRPMLNGELDVYYEYTGILAYGGKGYTKPLKNHENAVIIFNNLIRDIPIYRLMYFASYLSKAELTSELNMDNQKTPYIIQTTKRGELTLKNIFKSIDEWKRKIFVGKDVRIDNLIVHDLPTKYIIDKIRIEKKEIWNEAMSYIGIVSNSSEKRERQTDDEVAVSNAKAIASKNSRLKARKTAVKEINKLFNLTGENAIDVTYTNPLDDTVDNNVDNSFMEGAENG